MKRLNKIYTFLIYVLPAVLFFSYYPIISFGANENMNFEISLPLIWLVVFDVIAFGILVKKKLLQKILRKWQWWLLPIFMSFSVLWSPNLVRGILTMGILWLIYFAIFSFVILKKEIDFPKKFKENFWKIFFSSSLVVCAWCFLQCILDVVGVPRECTLMCRGCVSQAFGFPHPNGFAIEPQFMGNLLLAPTLVAAWLLMKKNKNLKHNGFKFIFFFIASTLFLTFSRGAIYAFVVAMIFMSVVFLVKKIGFKKIAMTWGVIVLSFLFALNLQGVLAQVSPTNDTYVSGVSKVLNHLSLGIIDIRAKADSPVEEVEVENKNDEAGENEAIYDGYVEESTNIRMGLTKNAIKVWLRDFKTMVLGVGIGGAGQAMYDAGLIGSPKEIVQNEYASILLETGLIGFLIIIFTFVMILKIIRKNPIRIIILTLGISYAVSLLFFSGFANALQIYLLMPVLYIVLRKKFVS